MASTRRRTDLWLTLLALALLIFSPVENALGNNLPERLPDPVANHALFIFGILLSTIVLVDLLLVVLRRRLADNAVDARRRRLRNGNFIFTDRKSVV